MVEQPDSEWLDPRRVERLERREERQRQLRRRRRMAVAALIAAALGAIAATLLALSGGGDTSPERTTGTEYLPPKSGQAGETGSVEVRNATLQPGWKPYTGPVPILEYHVLEAAPADAPYPELYVTRPDFHRQTVEEAGYAGATTEIPGYADRDAPYELARFEILGSTGVSGVAEDLASG